MIKTPIGFLDGSSYDHSPFTCGRGSWRRCGAVQGLDVSNLALIQHSRDPTRQQRGLPSSFLERSSSSSVLSFLNPIPFPLTSTLESKYCQTNSMSQSAPAEDSAQRSDSPPAQNDERNDEVAADENASLLPSDDISPPAGLSSPKAIYILTSLALAFSVSTLIFLIAAQIALAAGPDNFELGWTIRENMKASIAPVSTP